MDNEIVFDRQGLRSILRSSDSYQIDVFNYPAPSYMARSCKTVFCSVIIDGEGSRVWQSNYKRTPEAATAHAKGFVDTCRWLHQRKLTGQNLPEVQLNIATEKRI